jgi:hypothetical protein
MVLLVTFAIAERSIQFRMRTKWVGILCATPSAGAHLLTRLQVGFLSNIVKIFPSLAKRPLYLSGESYAGVYIVSCDHLLRVFFRQLTFCF